MTSPNIYLGADINHAPPNPYTENPAIGAPSNEFNWGQNYMITVTVRNTGAVSPMSQVELFWTDPSDGYCARPERRIGSADGIVPGHTDIPPEDGTWTSAFAWTPCSTATITNQGNLCLFARVKNLEDPPLPDRPQGYDVASPNTDPRSAFHEISVAGPWYSVFWRLFPFMKPNDC